MNMNIQNKNGPCRILGSHSSGYEEFHLLGYNRLHGIISQKIELFKNGPLSCIEVITYTPPQNYKRNTTIKITFRTVNTIKHILNTPPKINKYNTTHWGIYKLTCLGCQNIIYQTNGRSLNIRYNEHIRSIKSNKEDSAFAIHLLNNRHQYGKMENIMDKIDHAKIGQIMNIEKDFYIHIYKNLNLLIEEQKPAITQNSAHVQ
jgi:hypothetical protein